MTQPLLAHLLVRCAASRQFTSVRSATILYEAAHRFGTDIESSNGCSSLNDGHDHRSHTPARRQKIRPAQSRARSRARINIVQFPQRQVRNQQFRKAVSTLITNTFASGLIDPPYRNLLQSLERSFARHMTDIDLRSSRPRGTAYSLGEPQQ